MDHIFWVDNNLVGGRPGPNLIPWNPSDLASAGIRSILSVNDGELVHVSDLIAVGIEYLCTPLSENGPPRQGDIDTCVASLPAAYEFVSTNRELGKKTIVHCRQGRDRTGLFIAHYIHKQFGVSPEDAVRQLKEIRHDALAADGWGEFTLHVLRAC